MKKDYTEINAKTWDVWAKNGCCWSVPVTHDVFAQAVKGVWDVVLTPCKPVPKRWFAPFINENKLEGVKLLGLASGGGQQMPLFAALGAVCTVLDNSDSQLERESSVAEREGYAIDIVKADMTKRLPFADATFDVIFHPVSNCYIEDVRHVWRECFRVLKSGGILLAGMDNGFNFLVDDFTVRPLVITNKLPFNPLNMSDEQFQRMAENKEGIQFSHTLEEQIGGQLEVGFVLTDVYEDFSNDPDAIADGIPSYWASRAVKPAQGQDDVKKSAMADQAAKPIMLPDSGARTMKLLFLIGNTAVGKMTVGQELMKITKMRLFHNHMTIEPVIEIFGNFNTKVITRLREVIFEEFAASDQYGLIFTFMWAFDLPSDWDYARHVADLFRAHGAEIYYAELVAAQDVRLARNVTENRLKNKASKRDVDLSNQRLIRDDEKYRCVSYDGEVPFEHYIKIDNTQLPADVVARMIKDRFAL